MVQWKSRKVVLNDKVSKYHHDLYGGTYSIHTFLLLKAEPLLNRSNILLFMGFYLL